MSNQPKELFRAHGGQLRMSEAIGLGMTRYTLYSLLQRGEIERVSRGIYRLADLPPIGNPDLVTIGLRAPNAVICLTSALAYHDLTTQIPHVVTIAVLRGSRAPSIDHPPVQIHSFTKAAYEAGIEEHVIDGATVKIYNPEKTLADCFKFRNKIGMDVVQEALKTYRTQHKINFDGVIRYAEICRVEKLMRPYLEALV